MDTKANRDGKMEKKECVCAYVCVMRMRVKVSEATTQQKPKINPNKFQETTIAYPHTGWRRRATRESELESRE